MNELKPEDVMRALECCRYGGRCGECPCFEEPNCQALANDAALALIREKDAEIERLREMNDALESGFDTVKADIEQKMVDSARKQAFVAGDNQYISIAELEEIAKGVIK